MGRVGWERVLASLESRHQADWVQFHSSPTHFLQTPPLAFSKLRRMSKVLNQDFAERAANCSSTHPKIRTPNKKMQITITLRYYLFSPTGLAKIQTCDNTLCWLGCREMGNPTQCRESIHGTSPHARRPSTGYGNHEHLCLLTQQFHPGTPPSICMFAK